MTSPGRRPTAETTAQQPSAGTPLLLFVSPPGGSAFMHELLESVADAVRWAGGTAEARVGSIEDIELDGADPDSVVTVVVPHEYFAVHGTPDPDRLRRTIGFGVEHPGTTTFRTSAQYMEVLGACVEIAQDSVVVMRRRGVATERFRLGCSPRRDEPAAVASRDVDVLHLGTADESRLRKLAGFATQLAGLRTELLLPPHEPMTRERPDFVTGERKRQLLGRSKLLLNLHREGSLAFEWVRALDAIGNGCVVLTEPSSDLDPLVPGEHVLVASPSRLGTVARAALTDPDALDAIAGAAYELCTTELDIVASARRLVDLAGDLLARTRPLERPAPYPVRPRPAAAQRSAQPPMAIWVPCERWLPSRESAPNVELAELVRSAARLRHAAVRPVRRRGRDGDGAAVDVVCVRAAGDGPLGSTLQSLLRQSAGLALHVAEAVRENATTADAWAKAVTSIVRFDETVTRGRARNELLALGSAEFVFVLDAGDEVFAAVLGDLVAAMRAQPELQVAYPMAVTSAPMIVNALIAEPRRLAQWPYLGRGYLVRRSWLDRLDGFDESIEGDGFVDHDFWLRTATAGAPSRLMRQVGVRLWPQRPPTNIATLDPPAVRAHLDARAALAPELLGA